MFAPQTINIRYGNDGLLGQAAYAAGRGEYNLQQQDRQDANINNAMRFALQQIAQTNASSQATVADDLEKQKFDMAQAQAFRGRTPTVGQNFGTPLGGAIANAKSLARTTALGGVDLDPTQQAQLKSLENDPNVSAADYEGIVNKIRGNADKTAKDAKATADTAAEVESRKTIVRAAAKAGQIHQADMPVITQMALDPKFSTNDLRIALGNSFRKKQTEAASQVQQTQKHALYQAASSSIHPEDAAVIAPMLDDPKVTTEDIKQAITQSATRMKIEASQALSRQIANNQREIARSVHEADQIQKANQAYDFNAGEAQFTANGKVDMEGLAAYKRWQNALNKKAQLEDQNDKLATVGAGTATQQSNQQQFVNTATGPNGHKIGQLPSGQWVDAQTGQPVQ